MEYYLKKILFSISKSINALFSQLVLRLFGERNSLIIFLFHGLFRNEKEISLNHVDPNSHQKMTLEYFHQFIEYFLKFNYKFISPDDILKGLDKNNKYVLITFDDGYFNNSLSLPILKKYKIPAVFFISPHHVEYNKCFWWDVLYRERKKTKTRIQDIIREQESLKLKTNEEIEKYILKLFGKESFKPISNIDRPFTSRELRNFSKEKYVFLGNHTREHSILTNYVDVEIKSQILDAQKMIYEITGKIPKIISYPCGEYSKKIIDIARETELKLGVTITPKKNYLPINSQKIDSMLLGRFTLIGGDNLKKQCEITRADFSINNIRKILFKKNY